MIKDTYIKQVLKNLNFPKETKFAGYVVHLPDSDEFLLMPGGDSYTENWVWAKIPEMAKKYRKLDKARKEANRYGRGAKAHILLDIGEEYLLTDAKPMKLTLPAL